MARVVRNPSGYVSHGSTAAEKADNFAQYAKGHGWSGKWSGNDEPLTVHLFCRRGESETIDIWWHPNGTLMLDRLPVYTLAGERIKLRNVSAAALKVSSEPDPNRLRSAVRKQRGRGDILALRGSYDFEGIPDDEIEQSLLGHRIAWLNSISGQIDQANVEGRKTIKVTRENCKPQIHFTDTEGFHAVYLDAIVSVK